MAPLRWLITGSSSGLGEEFVRSILARGDKVVATARGDVSRISTLQEAGAETFSLDVTASPSEIKAVVNKILEAGPIDVLVNNAGYIEAAMAEEASHEQYQAQFDTNFFGVIKATQALLPHFREKKSGFIVFVGSVGGVSGTPGASPYCSSKFALEGWYDSLKQEIAPMGIKSTIFELGFFRTKIFHPDNLKFQQGSIEDYRPLREGIAQFAQGINGTQPGDPKKAIEIIIDVVKEEGVAQGKLLPDRLPLGPDSLATFRKRSEDNLAIANDWEGVITSTNFQ